MMEIKRYEFLLEATTPIAHHAEVFGNSAMIMRRKVRTPDGWAHVPIITGDTMRHGLREAAAYAFLDAAGMLDKGSLSEAALRLLFAGGMVTGRGDASVVKLDAYREMVDLMPPLALLGGCASNRVIPGRLTVDDAVLVCQESARFVPEWMIERAGAIDTCRAHVEVVQRVRMDPTLDPGKRKLLSDGASADAQRRLLASEAAHESDDAVDRSDAKSSMMPRSFECVVVGSFFAWTVEAVTYSDLDADTFNAMVASFLRNARVGGKRGTGHGSIRAVEARGVHVARPQDRTDTIRGTELAPKIGDIFRSHVAARKDRIAKMLAEVDA